MNLWLDGQHHYALEDMVPGKYAARDDANVLWEIDPTGGPIGEPCIKKTCLNNFGNDGLTVTAQRTQAGPWTGGSSGVFGCKIKVDDISKATGVGNINNLSNTFFMIAFGNTAMLGLGLNANGTFSLYPWQGYNGAPALEVSNGGLASAIWSSFEIKWAIHKTNGLLQVRHNRNLILNRTGLPVYPNNYPYPDPQERWSSVRIMGGSSVPVNNGALTMRMCHAYLNDLGGAHNNDFLGPIRVIDLKPNGPGAATEHGPSIPGPNWDLVKDVHPDRDGSYVTAGVIGAKDLYAHEDLPPGAIPLAVQSYQFVRAVTAGTPAVQTAIKMGGAVTLSPGLGLSGLTYGYQLQPFDTDPGTPGVPFTAANINAGEAGPGKQA